jgi:hypothetical protein
LWINNKRKCDDGGVLASDPYAFAYLEFDSKALIFSLFNHETENIFTEKEQLCRIEC